MLKGKQRRKNSHLPQTMGKVIQKNRCKKYATNCSQSRCSPPVSTQCCLPICCIPLPLAPLPLPPLQPANAIGIDGLNRLIEFNVASPGTITSVRNILNLALGETIVGADIRPSTGALYALSSLNNLYTIAREGAATLVAPVTGATPDGPSFGFDFNPVADAIRVISSSTGQNLSINPTTAVATVQSPVTPGTNTIVGAAYTNSVSPAPVSTILYTINGAATSTLNIQAPPATGVQTVVGPLTVAAGAFPALTGFDIQPGTNSAYLVTSSSSAQPSSLYSVNLVSGLATLIGQVGSGLTVSALTSLALL